MKKNDKKEIKEFLEERKKWHHFFEIIRRRYVYIPAIILLIYFVDNPDINFLNGIVKFLKKIVMSIKNFQKK